MKAENLMKAFQSYSRALFVAVISTYLANPDASIKQIVTAALVAVAAPILRAINPDDKDFGVGSNDKWM